MSLTHMACRLADALGFPSVALAQAPSATVLVSYLLANPWNPYSFQEEQLKNRIANQIASVELT